MARRAKANKDLRFTNVNNEDLDVLYANLLPDDKFEHDELIDTELAGVNDGKSDDSDEDSDYQPSQHDADSDDDESSDDESSDDENDEDQDQNNIESTGVEFEVENTDETTEIPGVDEVDETAEIPGVDEADETAEIPGVDQPLQEDPNGVDQPLQEDPNVHERTYQPPTDRHGSEGIRMNLRRQARQSYKFDRMGNRATLGDSNLLLNVKTTTILPRIAGVAAPLQSHDHRFKHFMFHQNGAEEPDEPQHFMFHQMGVEECTGMMMLQFDEDNNLHETKIDDFEIEYVFLTEQMNWKKGLKLFKEKGEDAITKELQQIHDMDGFQPKKWDELSKDERTKALRYLMYIKEKHDGKVRKANAPMEGLSAYTRPNQKRAHPHAPWLV